MGEPVSVVKLKNQEDSLYLQIHPQELHFPFELNKQILSSFQMSNKSDNYLAFKVKTTIPEKYCVRPNNGVVLPRSTCDIKVTMQAQKKAPPNIHCIDKFLIHSIVARPGATTEDITSEMFLQDSGYKVEVCKLRVVFDAPLPPNPPSPAQVSDFDLDQAKEQISKLTKEKKDAIEKNIKLQLELAKVQSSNLTKERNDVIEKNEKLEQELEMEISLIGFQNAGKSSLVNAVATGGYSEDMIPTVGFNMRKVTKGNVTIKIWDLGGQRRFRSLWERYCRAVSAIVYLVDAADPDNLSISRSELHDLLSKPSLSGIPLLVLGNKIDKGGAMSKQALTDQMDLKSITDREVCCFMISCKNSTNIDSVIDWLVKHSKSKN